jgi:xanthine dehydrogenase YagS FAD-binding subunit
MRIPNPSPARSAAKSSPVTAILRNVSRNPAAWLIHLRPADAPDRETFLQPADLITAVEIPGLPEAANSLYRKVRDRASYAFALVSVAAVLRAENGKAARVRLALGGVAPRPWRAHLAERELPGRPATEESFSAAAEAELAPATCRERNAF